MSFRLLFSGGSGGGATAYTDAATVALALTPSIIEVAELVDSGTTTFKLTPSALIEGGSAYSDSATTTLKFTPSATFEGTASYVDSATSKVKFTPSAVIAALPPPTQVLLPSETLAPTGILAPIGFVDEIASWYIVHKSIAGVKHGELLPNGLEFAFYLDRPGYINYSIDREHTMADPAYTQAYVTDWELYRGSTLIMAGMHTNVAIPDMVGEPLQISGQDWLHYLERRFYPFDPENLARYSQFIQTTTDSFTVVEDMLNVVLGEANSLPLTYSNGGSGNIINYKIELGDSGTILSKITDISDISPGFDFEVTPNKEFRMYAPQKVRTITTYYIAQRRNLSELTNYENKGIEATHMLAVGQGPQSKLGKLFEDNTLAATHRRHDKHVDFGNVTDRTTLINLGTVEFSRSKIPFIGFSLKIRPDVNIWNLITTGDKIYVDVDTDYERIQGFYRIIGLQGNVIDKEEEVTIHFDDPNA